MRNNLLALLVVTAAAACSTPPVEEPTFDNVYDHVLAPRCTFSACHASPTNAASLDLTREKACASLVQKPSCLFPNRMRIMPTRPEDSFFFQKLTGEGLNDIPTSGCSGESNQPMPVGGGSLPESELTLVRNWIAAGASCEGGNPDVDAGIDAAVDAPPTHPVIASVTVDREAPLAGEALRFTVTLDQPAPAGGQVIDLENPTKSLSAPVQVSVEPGATTATFDAYANRPTSLFELVARSGTSSQAIRIRIGGLEVAEVMNDIAGDDDRLQWIKLRNRSAIPLSLTDYRLRAGQTDYLLTNVALTGTIPAGGCIIVGGPGTSALNGNPVITQAFNFDPNLPVAAGQAKGYAVFDDNGVPFGGVAVPVDTMLVGASNTAQLIGVDAQVAAPFCGDVVAGRSARRSSNKQCISSTPAPAQCP